MNNWFLVKNRSGDWLFLVGWFFIETEIKIQTSSLLGAATLAVALRGDRLCTGGVRNLDWIDLSSINSWLIAWLRLFLHGYENYFQINYNDDSVEMKIECSVSLLP